jgi:hypothetical protein
MASSPPYPTPPLFSWPGVALPRTQRPSSPSGFATTNAPVVVVVQPSKVLLPRCRDAAAALGASLVACGLVSLGKLCHAERPTVIVVTEDLYAFDPPGFFGLARELGAILVQLQDDLISREALTASLRCALSRRG